MEEEITWFDRMRPDMLADIPHKTLHSQIFVNFDLEDLLKIEEILESFNTEHAKTLGKYEDHDIDLDAELAGATLGEAVQMFDSLTMENIIRKSSKKIIDLKELKNDCIANRVDHIINCILFYFLSTKPAINDDNISNCFIIASPLVISLFQAAMHTKFSPAIKGEFRGPNNTMLVGHVNKIPVYSYLFDAKNASNYIVGYNDPVTEEYNSQLFIIENLTFY